MRLIIIIPFLLILTTCGASTHWYVTENGRIEGQFDSVFNLRQSQDVMLLLKQEERMRLVKEMRQKLITRKHKTVGYVDEKDAELEQEFYVNNENCLQAGKPLTEFDLYFSTFLPLEYKNIKTSDHLHAIDLIPPNMTPVPQCQVLILNFSMHTYDHLESIQFRRHISTIPELQLQSQLAFVDDMETFGRQISYALYKNSSSWVAHYLASLYWRIKGNAYEAIECLRRSLYLTPQFYKDVVLLSLGNILHQSDRTSDAAILLKAATEVTPGNSIIYFTLANIYAIQLNFNESVLNYEEALRLDENFSEARLRRWAVLCHWQFEQSLQSKERSLQDTLSSLQDYQDTYEVMQSENHKINSIQTSSNEKLKQRNFHDYYYSELKSTCEYTERNAFSMLNAESLSTYFLAGNVNALPKVLILKTIAEEILMPKDICDIDSSDADCNRFN